MRLNVKKIDPRFFLNLIFLLETNPHVLGYHVMKLHRASATNKYLKWSRTLAYLAESETTAI